MTNVLEDLAWLISAEPFLLIPQRTEQWLPHLDRTEWCCSVLQLRANESKKSLPVFVLGNGKLALLAYATNPAVSCWLICHYLVVLCMGTHPWKLSSDGMSSAQCPTLTPAEWQQPCSPFVWWRTRFQAGFMLVSCDCQRLYGISGCERLPLCQCWHGRLQCFQGK